MQPYGIPCLIVLGCVLAASDAGAEPASPDSSRIVEVYQAERGPAGDPASPSIDPSGYGRPDMIVGIYDGEFELVPAGGLDNLRYCRRSRTWWCNVPTSSWSAPGSRSYPTFSRARPI